LRWVVVLMRGSGFVRNVTGIIVVSGGVISGEEVAARDAGGAVVAVSGRRSDGSGAGDGGEERSDNRNQSLDGAEAAVHS